jgi:hypothetical protein
MAPKRGEINDRTLALLNEGLALVIADGTYRHLHAKWFASLELPEARTPSVADIPKGFGETMLQRP